MVPVSLKAALAGALIPPKHILRAAVGQSVPCGAHRGSSSICHALAGLWAEPRQQSPKEGENSVHFTLAPSALPNPFPVTV